MRKYKRYITLKLSEFYESGSYFLDFQTLLSEEMRYLQTLYAKSILCHSADLGSLFYQFEVSVLFDMCTFEVNELSQDSHNSS